MTDSGAKEAAKSPLEMLVRATGATWAFYGSTMLALLGYVVFSRTGPPIVSSWGIGSLAVSLSLFFILNLVAIAGLQAATMAQAKVDGHEELRATIERHSRKLLVLHLLLDASALSTTIAILGSRCQFT